MEGVGGMIQESTFEEGEFQQLARVAVCPNGQLLLGT